MTQQRFDLLVIGGGLTGLALACAAAGEGLRVLLVERAQPRRDRSAAVRWPGHRDRPGLAPPARGDRRLAGARGGCPADPRHRGRRARFAPARALRSPPDRRRAARPHRGEPADPHGTAGARRGAGRPARPGRAGPGGAARSARRAGQRPARERHAGPGGAVRRGRGPAVADPRGRGHRGHALGLRSDRHGRDDSPMPCPTTASRSSGSSRRARSRSCR